MDSISRAARRGAGLRAGLVAGALLITAQGVGEGQARADVYVPCSTAALVTAIQTANGAGTPQRLHLRPACTYTLTAAAATGARGDDGLPIITNDITLVGNDAVIRRESTNKFRIFEVAGTLTLERLSIFGGDAGHNTGGGILSAHGTVSAIESVIVHNIADSGAGISNDSGQLALIDTWVRSNTTVPSAGGGGGGIYNDGQLFTQHGSIDNNEANTSGGGVYNELGGTMSVNDTWMDGNKAHLRGGGLYNGTGGEATFTRGQIKYNKAGLFGGGIYNAAGSSAITINDTVIHVSEPRNCEPSGSVSGCYH
jgi:hypothetical protein